jgi:hypothetical protein
LLHREHLQAQSLPQDEDVNPTGIARRETPASPDKWRFPITTSPVAYIAHRPGTTQAAVDSVWTAMYESNQRYNNHNNKL